MFRDSNLFRISDFEIRISSGQRRNEAALERSDNVADRSHAFAVLKRGYGRCSDNEWRTPGNLHPLSHGSFWVCGCEISFY
jgi:hypothetical protein